ncbi:hypothetical protein [Apibacter sp. HY039]|uniref:hypothetical protein n=1 Tax=Apibacter sp. HY039 TaxID=2501476 RepID=UPI000FEB78DA|nr:hypothetical protein [Apibacter sp. HY039]
MHIKHLLTALSILITIIVNGQKKVTQGIALNLGYSYVNTNTGYFGGEYGYRFNSIDWTGITIGAGAFMGNFNREFKFIPEAHVTYSHAILLGEFSITQHNINPSIGLHLFNLMRLKVGYSWKMGNENVRMQGITFGLNVLLGSSGFYDDFNLKVVH